MALFLNGSDASFIDGVSVGKPNVNKSGGKNIPLYNSAGRTTLKIATPVMMTWGAASQEFEAGKKTYSMSLQFPSPEYMTPDIADFLENVKKLEKLVLDKAFENSKTWFGKQQSPEIIKAFFNPLLYYSKDKATGEPDYTKQPSLRLKIPFFDGEFKTEIYNANHELIFPSGDADITEVVPKGSDVDTLLQASVWMAGGKFGITLKPIEVRVVRSKQKLERGVCHLKPLNTLTLPKQDPTLEDERPEVAAAPPTIDSDSEDDPEAEYTAPPSETTTGAPEVPVKGKRKVVKKP
jgi:hypothetical protein